MVSKFVFSLMCFVWLAGHAQAPHFQARASYTVKPTTGSGASKNYTLTFDAVSSVYQEENTANIEYKNSQERQHVSARKWAQKDYLITDTLENIPWQLQAESKKILGYNCAKAVAYVSDSKQTITAWYTAQIPTDQGPAQYSGLPGLILEISSSTHQFTCTQVTLLPARKELIQAPTRGQKCTRKQFEALHQAQTR